MKLSAAHFRSLISDLRFQNNSRIKNPESGFRALSAGFTLIELLVVIGILGILAAALVATIDPFEQLKKANDAKVQNMMVEFLTANLRYYTNHSAYPWDATAGNCNGGTAPSATALATGTTVNSCVTELQNDSELKQAYSSAVADLGKVLVTYDGTNEALIGCYRPESKSGRRNENTKFDNVGGAITDPRTACEGYGGTTQCYWCTR